MVVVLLQICQWLDFFDVESEIGINTLSWINENFLSHSFDKPYKIKRFLSFWTRDFARLLRRKNELVDFSDK